jgi:hypothetical protein
MAIPKVSDLPIASIQHQARTVTLAGTPDLIRVYVNAGTLNTILLFESAKNVNFTNLLAVDDPFAGMRR